MKPFPAVNVPGCGRVGWRESLNDARAARAVDQRLEDRQHVAAVFDDAVEEGAVLWAADQFTIPAGDHLGRHFDVPPEPLDGMAAEEEAVEEGCLPLRILEILLLLERRHGRSPILKLPECTEQAVFVKSEVRKPGPERGVRYNLGGGVRWRGADGRWTATGAAVLGERAGAGGRLPFLRRAGRARAGAGGLRAQPARWACGSLRGRRARATGGAAAASRAGAARGAGARGDRRACRVDGRLQPPVCNCRRALTYTPEGWSERHAGTGLEETDSGDPRLPQAGHSVLRPDDAVPEPGSLSGAHQSDAGALPECGCGRRGRDRGAGICSGAGAGLRAQSRLCSRAQAGQAALGDGAGAL